MDKGWSLLFMVLLLGCGSGSNESGGGKAESTAGNAQGFYRGLASSGYAFESIVLPNDQFYGIYGTLTATQFVVYGMISGQGTSGGSTFTAPSVTNFFYTGATYSGSLDASFVAGSSFNGSLDEDGTVTTFTGAPFLTPAYNYDMPASISEISGSWSGSLLNGAAATVTISDSGEISGSSSGCSFSGTATQDSSNKNFFNVILTFGGSPCVLPNQAASGIGIEYILSNSNETGPTFALAAAVTSGTQGTAFGAVR